MLPLCYSLLQHVRSIQIQMTDQLTMCHLSSLFEGLLIHFMLINILNKFIYTSYNI
jgi:hypothetical protein